MVEFAPNLRDSQLIGDAQRELDDAMVKGDAALAAWARRWGQPAIDAIEDAAGWWDTDGDEDGDDEEGAPA